MKKNDLISNTILEFLNENHILNCTPINLTNELIDEVNKYDSSESLLRSGGVSIESLDRAAYGFSSEDITSLMPNQLNVKWKDDLANVKYEIDLFRKKIGDISLAKAMKMWANNINLSEPIDVSYENNKFYIEDGHHRYYAAKILNKPLNVNLEIKMNPIKKLAPKLSYDDFHRCLFNQIKNN